MFLVTNHPSSNPNSIMGNDEVYGGEQRAMIFGNAGIDIVCG